MTNIEYLQNVKKIKITSENFFWNKQNQYNSYCNAMAEQCGKIMVKFISYGKVLIVNLHNKKCDEWIFGKDFSKYKVTDNALVLMDEDGAWIAWYNLTDVQNWYIE